MLTNGTPWKVATVRGVATAILLGAAGALAMWSQVDDLKQIVIAGATPFIGTLLTRVLGEGFIDSPKPAP